MKFIISFMSLGIMFSKCFHSRIIPIKIPIVNPQSQGGNLDFGGRFESRGFNNEYVFQYHLYPSSIYDSD